MAVDWIKMRADLLTHPKVVRIASALKADKLRVIGGLHAVWCLFDAHTVDGNLEGYTAKTLDDHLGWSGFAGAMTKVGWLEQNGESLAAPRFDEHNGQSAKRRAMESERKRESRKASASDADKKRTREEKRRDTSAKADVDAASGSTTTGRGTRLPNTWVMSPEDKAFCEQHRPDLVPADVEAQFRDFWTSKAGKDGVKLDWAATFRNWVRSQRQLPGSAPGERVSWWSSKTGITAKGLELVIPGPADASDAAWFEFMAAVWLAAGDGPWLDEKSRAYPIYKRLRDGAPALSVVHPVKKAAHA